MYYVDNNASGHFENCWRSDGFWIWKIQVQGPSPIGWYCRRFSLVPFYPNTSSHWFIKSNDDWLTQKGIERIHWIKKTASDWFLGSIDRFSVGNAPIDQFEFWRDNLNFGGKIWIFGGTIWMLAGKLLTSGSPLPVPVTTFPVAHAHAFTSGDFR